ncbi:MAG: hypothetical protein ACRBM6_23375 [Geminicoccales bacterium]
MRDRTIHLDSLASPVVVTGPALLTVLSLHHPASIAFWRRKRLAT